ncbi:hypothetical protein JW824_05355 [bacterium]|nr:hypothetical protein [bacterium]RQV96303.1 MAG: hypothetical protein EH221_04860 [bacterium]
MEDQHASSEVLRQEILSQSEKEVQMILDRAGKESQALLDNVREEEKKILADSLQRAKVQADGIRKKILSGVHLEIKRQTLRAREELIENLFQAVEEKLDRFRSEKDYVPFLKKLIIEGILALDGNEIKILPGEKERKILTGAFITQLEKTVQKEYQKKAKLALMKQSLPEGGVVLVTDDEKMRFDNRFSTRMKRLQNAMRLESMKRMLEKQINKTI